MIGGRPKEAGASEVRFCQIRIDRKRVVHSCIGFHLKLFLLFWRQIKEPVRISSRECGISACERWVDGHSTLHPFNGGLVVRFVEPAGNELRTQIMIICFWVNRAR